MFTPDLKKCALAEPAAIEAAEFWGAMCAKNKIATPANANPRDAFLAGKLAMWISGSWNFTGLRDAKMDFAVAPVPKIFKQPTVFTIPHQFSFPKPKAVNAAKREAAWSMIRWLTDHVAEWTLRAGQVSVYRKAHTDPRITGDPVLRTLLAQAPNWQNGQATPKWVAAENLTRPEIESCVYRTEGCEAGDGGAGPPDRRVAGLTGRRGRLHELDCIGRVGRLGRSTPRQEREWE